MPKKKEQKTNNEKIHEEFKVNSKDLVDKVKSLIKEGNVRRIIIKNKNGKSLMEIPVTFAVVGTVLVPVFAAIGAMEALLGECSIIVERRS